MRAGCGSVSSAAAGLLVVVCVGRGEVAMAVEIAEVEMGDNGESEKNGWGVDMTGGTKGPSNLGADVFGAVQ